MTGLTSINPEPIQTFSVFEQVQGDKIHLIDCRLLGDIRDCSVEADSFIYLFSLFVKEI